MTPDVSNVGICLKINKNRIHKQDKYEVMANRTPGFCDSVINRC